MNKNQSLILVIVIICIFAVGSFVFYTGKSSNTLPKNTEEISHQLDTNQDQNNATGLNVSLDMTNPDVKTYKTIFTAEFAKPVNFDKHFRVIDIGCGSSCMYLYALDKNNGKVYKISTEPFTEYSTVDNQIRAVNQDGQVMIYIFDSQKGVFVGWAV
jgi:hypothetical protein